MTTLYTNLINAGVPPQEAESIGDFFSTENGFLDGLESIATWLAMRTEPAIQPPGQPWMDIYNRMKQDTAAGGDLDSAFSEALQPYPPDIQMALTKAVGARLKAVLDAENQAGTGGRKSASTLAVNLLLDKLDFFCDPVGAAWVGIPVNAHTEYVPVNSMRFRSWMGRRYFEKYHRTMGSAAQQDAITVFVSRAADSQPREVYTRIAHYQGKLYIDLCNQKWEFVEVDPAGWHIITNPPIPFRRPRGMKPLPTPILSIELDYNLRDFINLDDEGWHLVMGWLLGAFGPGDYPILVLNGEQGSGKSTLSELLRRLIDPNEADLRGSPREEQALMIAAKNSHVLAFDNLSNIPDWFSDSLCRISTGAGFATRELYTDLEETIISVKKPILINGITDLVTRGDLLSRSIVITVPALDDSQRIAKDDFWRNFEAAQPTVFGIILDILSIAIRDYPKTTLTQYPRMADFARWVVAAGPSMGWGPDQFLITYETAAQNSIISVLDYSMVAAEIQVLTKQNPNWRGTTMELLEKLRAQSVYSPSEDYFHKLRPSTLAGELRRLAPILRKVGIDIVFHKPARVKGRVVKEVEIRDCSVLVGVVAP